MNVFRLLTLADYEIWEPESRFERRLFVNDEAIFCSARLSYLIFNRYGLGVRHSHCGWAVEKETTRRVEKRRLRQKEEKKKTKWATSVEKKDHHTGAGMYVAGHSSKTWHQWPKGTGLSPCHWTSRLVSTQVILHCRWHRNPVTTVNLIV